LSYIRRTMSGGTVSRRAASTDQHRRSPSVGDHTGATVRRTAWTTNTTATDTSDTARTTDLGLSCTQRYTAHHQLTNLYYYYGRTLRLPLYFAAVVSFFFLSYFQRSQSRCLPYFHTWCGLRANLECRSEICCLRLAENTGRKNYAKNRHLLTIAQLCRAIFLFRHAFSSS